MRRRSSMAKKLNVFVQGVGQLDADSIEISLDFDGIKDVPAVMKVVDARFKTNKRVTIWDVLVVLFFINRQNREVRDNGE